MINREIYPWLIPVFSYIFRLDNVADFLEIATSIGVDKGEIPNLAQAPQSLIDKMESLGECD